jgi:hypothetical protein
MPEIRQKTSDIGGLPADLATLEPGPLDLP